MTIRPAPPVPPSSTSTAAALIHDDIADDSQLRRGKPCLHHQVGEGLAINAGDLALSLVTGTVLVDDSLTDAIKLRVLKELVDMTTRTDRGPGTRYRLGAR